MTVLHHRIRQLPITPSTNADAIRAAESGEAEGLVIQALRQTAGKGRRGRTWESPEGNVYASALLRPRCPAEQAGYCGFAAALAIYDAVRAFLPDADIKLKWPNDVLVSGKKISGILLEAAPVENGIIEWLVVGVGVNVLHHPELALYPATSLKAEGADISVQQVLGEFLRGLSHWKERLQREGFAAIREAWLAKAKTGKMVVRQSGEDIEGTFSGIDLTGHLILKLADGSERIISTGDAFFVTD